MTDIRRGRGCPICRKFEADNKKRKTTEEFRKEIFELTNGEFSLIGEYGKKNTDPVLIQHNRCRSPHTFMQSPASFLRGLTCPKCNESIGERRIRQYLENKNIEFIQQYKFTNSEINTLRFDFYLPKYNICIEFDGMQHFMPIQFGSSEDDAISDFKSLQERDQRKNNYCDSHNITLVRISYLDFKEIEQKLDQLFQGLQ